MPTKNNQDIFWTAIAVGAVFALSLGYYIAVYITILQRTGFTDMWFD